MLKITIKSAVALCLACVIMFSCFSFGAFAEKSVAFSFEKESVTAGDTVALTVTLKADGVMNAFSYDLIYNKDELSFVKASSSSINSTSVGVITFVDDADGNTVSTTYYFTTKKPGNVTVTVQNALCADTQEYEYDDTVCTFEVLRATTGDVNDDGIVNISDLATLKLYLAGATADVNREYSDINKDNSVDISDLANLKLYLAGAL